LDGDLDDATLQNPRGLLPPDAVRVVQSGNAIIVSQIEDVDLRLNTPSPHLERSRDSPVDLVDAVAEHTGGGVASPVPNVPIPPFLKGSPINNFVGVTASGAVIAIDPTTGQKKWKYEMVDVTTSGILTTASDLLFTGGREGHFMAFDAADGNLLWKASLGGQIVNGPISYEVDGAPYVAAAAGNSLFTFGVRD
jgi:outer membrane protein assembly factor BamB